MDNQLLLSAEWTDDCQGKKDYDSNILSISTRYWPRGGSALLFDTRKPEQDLHHADDGTPPSARSDLILRFRDSEAIDDYVILTSQTFEGETQADVQRQVEVWAQEQMDQVVAILRQHFEFKSPFA